MIRGASGWYSALSVAGTGAGSSSGTGGKATAAALFNPQGTWVDTLQTVYFSEYAGFCIRKFSTSDSIVVNMVGVCGTTNAYNGDGIPATSAYISAEFITGSSTGTFYAVDTANNRIRKVVGGIISTIAGTGGALNTGDGGAATAAQIGNPTGIFADTTDKLYIGSYALCKIRVISQNIISTFTG